MNYTYYLGKFWCKVFLKPESDAFKKFPEFYVFKDERNKVFVSGNFVKIDITAGSKTSYHGSLNKFYFVNKMELPNYNNSTDDKQKYVHEISVDEIISIEMIFDEIEYSK